MCLYEPLEHLWRGVNGRYTPPVIYDSGFQNPLKPPYPKSFKRRAPLISESPHSWLQRRLQPPSLERQIALSKGRLGQVRCRRTPSPPGRPQRGYAAAQPTAGRTGTPGPQTAPPAAFPSRSEPPGLQGPGATYRACKPENRQRRRSSFGAMVRWSSGSRVWGLQPGAASSGARASPPRALPSLAASDATDCGATRVPGHRGRTGVGSGGPPRPRRPAGLRPALRGARGAPCHRGAPPPPAARRAPAASSRLGAGSAQPGGGSGWARAVPSPAAPQPRAALPPLQRTARGCTGGGLCARCAAAARSEVGAARLQLLWQRLRGGPGGEEFPLLHAWQRVRRRKQGLNGLKSLRPGRGRGSAGEGRPGDPIGSR